MSLGANVGSLMGFWGVLTSFLGSGLFGWDGIPTAVEYKFPVSQIEAMNALAHERFPENFLFGVSTSAYQVEGGWNASDKGPSVWDYMTHMDSSLILDHSNADVSADSYHKYKQDIELAKKLGSKVYRISLSWPRILPDGSPHKVSLSGIQYYNNVINEMLKHGIQPFVTIFHWDLPYPLQQIGGFTNELVQNYFVMYAKIVFEAFGDRVKHWITINEPNIFCSHSYGGDFIPLLNRSGTLDYLCGHNILLSHARVYQLYNEEFRSKQNGKVGIVIAQKWLDPENPKNEFDLLATEMAYQWSNGWFVNPIFGKHGDYPPLMKEYVELNSMLQGYRKTRLPQFTRKEVNMIKDSADFLGVNYYTSSIVRAIKRDMNIVNFNMDAGIQMLSPNYPGEFWVKNTPRGLGKVLLRLEKDYKIPEMYITENGYADSGQIEDLGRVVYHHQHLWELIFTMQKGVNLKGYLVWSLVDNFEWMYGYSMKFGLFHINFGKDPILTRHAKLSATVVADVFKTHVIRPMEEVLRSKELADKARSEYGFPTDTETLKKG